MTANPKWPLAYHYPTDSNLTIDEVLEMRKGNDPRAGDLHCHKGCYPHSGTKILSRDCSASNSVSHFSSWPGEQRHPTTCAYYSVATSRREHINYAQYLHDLRAYFEEVEGTENDPFMIESLEFPTGLMAPCISIKHRETANLGWNVTNFIIVHSNHGRAPRNAQNGIFRHGDGFDIVIRITEFTEEQLGDFQRTGIERLKLSWEKLLEHAAQEAEREAEERRLAEEEQNMLQIQGAILDNEIKFNTKLDVLPFHFSRPEDVDGYFNEVFRDQIEAERAIEEQRRIEQEAFQAEIQKQISELSNELGFTVDRKFTTMEDFEAYAEGERKEKKKRERNENRARYNEAYGELKKEFSEFDFTSLTLPTYICNNDQFNDWIQKTRERCEVTLTEYKSARAKVFAAFDGFDFNQDELQLEKIPYGYLEKGTITNIASILFEKESRRKYPGVMKTQTVDFTLRWLENARKYIPRCDDTISKILLEFKIGKLLSNLAWDTLLEIVPNYGDRNIDWYREECAKTLTTLVENHPRLHQLDKLENRSSEVLLLIDRILRETLGEKTDSVLQEYGVEIHSAEGYNFLRTFTPPEGLKSSLIDLVVSPDEKSEAFEKFPKWMTAGDHASLDDVMRSFFQP